MYADNKFDILSNYIEDKYKVCLNCAAAEEHVPEAKNNNKVLKEYTRVGYHAPPFKALPHKMTKYLVTKCAKKLNFFPPKGGISPYFSS